MKINFATLSNFLGLSLIVSCLATAAIAQEDASATQSGNQAPHGKYVTLPPRLRSDIISEASLSTPKLTTWNGSFTYHSTRYTYNMVGTAPSTNISTTIPVYIVPIKIVITSGSTKSTFDPSHVLSNGKTVIQNTVTSPIFDASTSYIQGGTNVGKTQYIDAYQRANFWGTVQTHLNYHLLLAAPTILPEQTLSPSSGRGKLGSPFGTRVGLVDIDYFDAQIQGMLSRFTQIHPNSLPIFITYNVYLTQGGGCCIGGYHSAEGSTLNPQAYAHFTYIDHPGEFAQDVSALSHEVGEWADDPLVVNNGNNSPCGILENGDPLENNPNFGGHPYTLHGFVYNLQDLAMLPYFGAPLSTSVHGWLSFQHAALSVCSNGS